MQAKGCLKHLFRRPLPFPLKYRIPIFQTAFSHVSRPIRPQSAARLKPRTTLRRNLATAIRPRFGGRGQRQNARADHAHRMAVANRSGKRTQHYGGNVYQQSCQRDANPTRRDDSHQRPRHVARHVPRLVPPLSTAAPPRRRFALFLSNPRQRRPAFPHQTPAQKPQHRRRNHRAAFAARLYQRAKRIRFARFRVERARPAHAPHD